MHRRTIWSSVAFVAGISALAPADSANAAPTGKFSATKLGGGDMCGAGHWPVTGAVKTTQG
jgi:hypothetical protein